MSAVLFFSRLGTREVTSEEFRWAEVAREMQLSGDYFHPTINLKTYYDKPLGSYWLVVAASWFTGEIDETAARLPAALAAWLGVWLTMLIACHLYGSAVAPVAGIIVATSFGYLVYARRATADMETTVGVLATVWLFTRQRGQFGAWVILVWMIMSLTALTKGLLGFVLPCVIFFSMGEWSTRSQPKTRSSPQNIRLRQWISGQQWFFQRWTLLAIPIAGLVYLVPFALSRESGVFTEGLWQVYRENIARFFSPRNHVGPVYLYVGVIFVLFAPWSLLLPASLTRSCDTPKERLAIAYFWAVFVFFTLSASRRSYYLLPILPAASLLIARHLHSVQASKKLTRILHSLGFAIWVGALIGGVIVLSLPRRVLPTALTALPPPPAHWVLLTLGAGSIIAIIASIRLQWPLKNVLIGSSIVMQSYLFLIAQPAVEELRTRSAFVKEVRDKVHTDYETIGLLDARELIFDLRLRPPVPEYASRAQAENALRQNQIKWLIAAKGRWGDAIEQFEVVASEELQPWERKSVGTEKMILLRLRRR